MHGHGDCTTLLGMTELAAHGPSTGSGAGHRRIS